MKKRLGLLLVLFAGLLSISNRPLKAAPGDLVSSLEGVSIRKKTSESQQGLRFYARLDESVKNNEHGFYLIYGKTSIQELKYQINNSSNDEFYLNGKQVFKVKVPGFNKDNIYSVVLTGIPEDGYFDLISVIPYVMVNEEIHLPKVFNERSIAQVALNMANSGESIDDIVQVNQILNSKYKRAFINSSGDIKLVNGVYEFEKEELKRQFIEDWKRFFNVSFDDLIASEFFLEAKKGTFYNDLDSNDISMINLYKFFNDPIYKNKWKWLLGYIIDNSDLEFLKDQAKAILNDGKGVNLFNAAHLTYSIVNFFNQDNVVDEYFGIDFTNLSMYDEVKNYNNGVFVDLGKNNLLDEGKTLILPKAKERKGYNFRHYLLNDKKYYPNDLYTVKAYEETLKAVYELVSYSVSFYDDMGIIDPLSTTYNIEDSVNLPVYNISGHVFVGWYETRDFKGLPITHIEKGNVGEKKFYGKWEKTQVDPVNEYNINYYVNGGIFNQNVTLTYKENEEVILPIPVKEGYNFLGWYENSNFSGSPIGKINKGTEGNKTFYARWGSLTPTVEEKLDEAKNALNITFASGDNSSNVTKNVTLPTSSMHNVSISWSSSNIAAINSSGVVNRSSSNVSVTLTATIKLDNKSVTKSFTLIVLKLEGPTVEEKLEDAKNALSITYTSGDSATKVTKNVTLPTSSMHNASVSWSSSNIAAINSSGIVNRSGNNVVVTLTATIKLDNKSVTKAFTLTVLKVEPAPDIEYTITYHLNGGTWPTTGGTAGYANRNEMVIDFLTDFYNFVKPAGISLNDFMHGPGKTSGFDGMYGLYNDETPYFDQLYQANSKSVNANVPYFINQPEYNKWVALIDVMEEYTNFSVDADGNAQSFWASPWTGARRIVPFMKEENLWNHIPAEDVKAVTGKIPTSLKGGTTGDPITVPTKYKATDNDITLPKPEKANDAFIGWYTDTTYRGSIVTKITKGTTGNKIFYARYNSTEVQLTNQEKLDLAYNDLSIGYGSGDNANSVTKNISLKTSGLHGSTISWTSTNTSVLSTSGVVNRLTYDVTVTLKATVKIGSLTKVKEFRVTVINKPLEPTDQEKVNLAKNALNITFASGDSATKVTKNVTLPRSGLHNATISWATNNASTVSSSGVVVRKENDVNVTLTATIKVGSATTTKTFSLKVIKEDVVVYTIEYVLNSGNFGGYKNKTELGVAFFTDLYNFVAPGGTLNTFIHGSGKTSGFGGTWYSNEEYRAKIYAANVKSGNNNYFLSSATYQTKWKPFADFMVSFVKVGNPDQDFWASPYTGNLRISQYFTNTKPGAAWTSEDMNKLPTGLSASATYEYNKNSPTINLPSPVREGFNFQGWYLNANFTGSKVTSIPKGSTGNKKFYAKWEMLIDPVGRTQIKGAARIPLSQALAWVARKNPADLFVDAAQYYWEFGELMNIRPEVLYAQAALETYYGRYGGAVQPWFHNFAGIKTRYATGDTSNDFERFPTRRDGVRGHFNHMCAYIGQQPHGTPHGRYYAVLTTAHAGKVQYVEGLTRTWAMDPLYDTKLREILNELLFFNS